MKIAKLLLSIGCVAVLGACTDNGLLFRSFGSYDKKDADGVYKVGAPYQVKGIWYTPAEDYDYSAKGMASWYEGDPDNPLTDNGEVFDADQLTARHRTLPLPSLVRITNLENGNTAIVRVNDRGPYVHNRLIDVSHKVAEALEFQEQGTTFVQVDILADESKSMKDQLIQAGRYVETPAETAVVADDGAADEPAPDTPIYQPDSALTPLYKPVETAALPPLPDESADADAGEADKAKEPDELQETEVLYAGGATTPVSADSAKDSTASVTQSDTPAADALVQAVRHMTDKDKTPASVASEPTETADDTVSVTDNVVSESTETADSPKPTAEKTVVETKQTAVSVDLTQPVTRPQKTVSFQEYFVQAGAFSKAENADKAREVLSVIGGVVTVPKTVGGRELTIVRVGPFETPTAARAALDKIKKAGYADARIVSQ